jgi:hypothetical protein
MAVCVHINGTIIVRLLVGMHILALRAADCGMVKMESYFVNGSLLEISCLTHLLAHLQLTLQIPKRFLSVQAIGVVLPVQDYLLHQIEVLTGHRLHSVMAG